MKKQQGFTLIELMIVVAVIGVLSAIAIPAYQGYVIKSEAASGLATLRSLQTNVDTYIADNGSFPSDSDLPGMGAATDMNELGTISLSSTSGGSATFTFDQGNTSIPSTETLVMSKDDTSGLWTCISNVSDITLKGCPSAP
ncbi:pilin [Photobacterium leiognathi]|uniref:pilin n=1 Tax=Photobacterium leiognathi TaxID=553611 RepID=UPI0029812648|nr:pilin [Photobacterium leiognathi]